jgi:mono/diheme cytochrome c family protein
MIPHQPIVRKLSLIVLSFLVFSNIKIAAQDPVAGKALFSTNCASCHAVNSKVVGPPLADVESQWDDPAMLRRWIRNYQDAIDAGYPRAKEIVNYAPTAMQVFGSALKDADIDNILAYIKKAGDEAKVVKKDDTASDAKPDNSGSVIFGVISLIMGIIALIMMQVNSNLKKLSDDKEGIQRPEPVVFYKNKVYIALASIIFFVIGGFLIARDAIGLGRQVGYQPVQPIYYSHKVHAGLNQINCLYCHGGAMDGKQASIPSVNVCMNCHKQISEYKGPAIYNEAGEMVNGTNEIMKLYQAAGVDPKNPQAFDPAKAKQIQWTRIHNLPDHAYFNHSQHVNAGKVQCQTCHGEITSMHEVKQVSELSMSWCINCHRQTNVNFNYDSTGGNKFYSIYEKFHNDIKAGKMDSVKVENIGGLECQKCHY